MTTSNEVNSCECELEDLSSHSLKRVLFYLSLIMSKLIPQKFENDFYKLLIIFELAVDTFRREGAHLFKFTTNWNLFYKG